MQDPTKMPIAATDVPEKNQREVAFRRGKLCSVPITEQ